MVQTGGKSVSDCAEAETGPLEQKQGLERSKMVKETIISFIPGRAGALHTNLRQWSFYHNMKMLSKHCEIVKIWRLSGHCSNH